MANTCIKCTVNIIVRTRSPTFTMVMSPKYDGGERGILNIWKKAYITAKTTAERKQVFTAAAAQLFNYWVEEMKTAPEKDKGFTAEEKQRREKVSSIGKHMRWQCQDILPCVGSSSVGAQQLAWQTTAQKDSRRRRSPRAGRLSHSPTKDGQMESSHH